MLRLVRPAGKVIARCINTSATKIVATIGPASENMPILQHVVDAGLKIMRINFSHATFDEADLRLRNLRLVSSASYTMQSFGRTQTSQNF